MRSPKKATHVPLTVDRECSTRPDALHSASLAELVADYIATYRPACLAEEMWYAGAGSIEQAIRRAASCEMSGGKRHGHQRRIPRAALAQITEAILQQPIARARDFEDIYCYVRKASREVDGIGDLTCYDIAQRIGVFLRLSPTRAYLHAGTRDGARALGLDAGAETIAVTQFPAEMQRLSASEIEDFLCIYKEHLHRHAPRPGVR